MKLHEKILTHYHSCTSPVDKEGYLFKKKAHTATYHRRWCVLKANLLFYQEKPADRHLHGVIVLEGCAVRRSQADGQFAFSLVFDGPGLKTYSFAAGDLQSQESWVRALLSASHCYLSLLLRDLGRQYEEAKKHQGSDESCPSAPKESRAQTNQGFVLAVHRQAAEVRDARSFSDSAIPEAHKKRSPKLWHRRNAHVTPLNGPGPLCTEWPLVDFDPLEDFGKLHDYYGQEVKRAREEWLRNRPADEG